jgi:MinD superfamily P-loop ATPase
MTEEIEASCAARGVQVLGRIPFDPAVVAAQIQGVPVVNLPQSPAAEAIRSIWRKMSAHL